MRSSFSWNHLYIRLILQMTTSTPLFDSWCIEDTDTPGQFIIMPTNTDAESQTNSQTPRDAQVVISSGSDSGIPPNRPITTSYRMPCLNRSSIVCFPLLVFHQTMTMRKLWLYLLQPFSLNQHLHQRHKHGQPFQLQLR